MQKYNKLSFSFPYAYAIPLFPEEVFLNFSSELLMTLMALQSWIDIFKLIIFET